MDSNGNQRKRSGRMAKNINGNERSSPRNIEQTEVMEVSTVAVSPTLEESESTNNAPISECRRSSRKKIIKFDVRDLLNKNRKTHKIQIEARIDSNAPSTSKGAATAASIETMNSKTAPTTSREDLLSKHKTFLEKSAIFRRYSVSQEHKPPPPPLPMPPLLGKSSDNNDCGFSGTSSCQEFLSHALIKPKEPTSLIVAQIESNKPSSVITVKRKNQYKPLDMNAKLVTSTVKFPVTQPKKRGRPAKNKTQTSVGTTVKISVPGDSTKKKITFDEAKNWKEYKACMAQQSSSRTTEEKKTYKKEEKSFLITEHKKDTAHISVIKRNEIKNFDDALQSDISRSDDDGNFSGFQNSKDEISCDSPLLATSFAKEILQTTEAAAKNCSIAESVATAETKTKEEILIENKKIKAKTVLNVDKNLENYKINSGIKISSDFSDHSMDFDASKNEVRFIENKGFPKSYTVSQEKEITCDIAANQLITSKLKDLEDHTTSNSVKVEYNRIEESQELQKLTFGESGVTTVEAFSTIQNVETSNQSYKELQTTDVLLNSTQTIGDFLPITKDDISNMKVLVNSMSLPLPSISSDRTTSISRTSSSSESDNAFERSSCSSEQFSNASSSSSRSYKSGDKLKVSIKRIPLPKSPSTSSQTSTSEEFSNADVLKRRPPIGKRSKRIQKNRNDGGDISESADDCFQRILNEEFDKGLSIEKSTLSVSELESSNIPKTVIPQPITKCIIQDFNDESVATKISEPLSIAKPLSAKDIIIERRSLGNYKDKESINKDQQTKYLEHVKQDKLISTDVEGNKKDENNFKKSENEITTAERNLFYDCSGNLADNEVRKLHKKVKQITITLEETIENEKNTSMIETENKTSETTETLPDAVKPEEISKDTTIACTPNKEDNSTKDLKSPSDMPDECGDQDIQSVKFTSEEIVLDIRDTTKPLPGNSTVHNKEYVTLNESMVYNVVAAKSEKEICTKDLKAQLSENTEITTYKNISLNRKFTEIEKEKGDNYVSNESDINKEEILQKDFDFQGKKHIDIAANEKSHRDHSKKSFPEDLANLVIAPDTTSYENLFIAVEAAEAHSSDRNYKIKLTKNKTFKKISEEEAIRKGTEYDKTTPISEVTKTFIENSNLISEKAASYKSEEGEDIDKDTEYKKSTPISELTKTLIVKISEKVASRNRNREDITLTESSLSNVAVHITEQLGKTNMSKTLQEELITTKSHLRSPEILMAKNIEDNKDLKTDRNREDKKTEISTKKAVETEAEPEAEAKLYPNKSIVSTENEKDFPNVITSTKSKTSGERNSQSIHKKSTYIKGNRSPQLLSQSQELCTTEVSLSDTTAKMFSENFKSFQDENLVVENVTGVKFADTKFQSDGHSEKKLCRNLSPPTCSSTKTVPLLHADSKATHRKNLAETGEAEPTKEMCISNTQQENICQRENKQVLVASIKRRGKKPRFRNLHNNEVDSETDSSNGNNTPINEVVTQKLMDEARALQKEVECKLIQTTKSLSEIEPIICENEEKTEDINVSKEPILVQENVPSNLLSTQIKNFSIETNTLLDILRTVESNKNAALKTPVYIDETDNDDAIETANKVQFDESCKSTQDLLKIQREMDTSSTIPEAGLMDKRLNLSPVRSDSLSPLTLKKVTTSPTRSTSSSPLTLKKVTRRYERRSRRVEGSAHRTLEETFAEIAAQSSKAVLAAKEFDDNEDQNKTENLQKELNTIDTAPNVGKEQIKESFADIEKASILGEMLFNAETKVDENVGSQSLDLDKSAAALKGVEIELRDNVGDTETEKLNIIRRGRKPKNRSIELATREEKETLEETNPASTSEEVVKDTNVYSVADIIDNWKEDDNTTITFEKVNESLDSTPQENSSDDKTKTLLSSPSDPESHCREKLNLSETNVDQATIPFEDVTESELRVKNQKTDNTTYLEADILFSNIDRSCQDKDDEIRTAKHPLKKRDPSLSKNESKSVGKKVQKKSKNEEDDSLNVQKEEAVKTSTTASTPPPSKRGRKPKNLQTETPQSDSKKKNKKDACTKNDDEDNDVDNVKLLDSENESLNNISDKSLDEKSAKKKRQKKLKEAFEAALKEDKEKCKDTVQTEPHSPTNNCFAIAHCDNSPPSSEKNQSISNEELSEATRPTCITPAESEEDLDPLKDIEKFIADGVNLLKKDYKLDEDSVDDVMQSNPSKTTKVEDESLKPNIEEAPHIFNTFETPADTPLNTPSATPPPKSPTSIESTIPDESCGVRRSHRIKLITKTPKALVGRGLVRDRERFSIKDDVETKSHYSMDDHLMDLAEVEAKNAKFLKEMEERLSNFQVIKENEYLCERVISREARKMICDCFLTHEEEGRGELGCGEDCLNRLLMIECGPDCNVKERCTNKGFQKLLCSPCRVFRTEKKGFGILADIEILPGEFIMEYVGEVIDTEEFEKRRVMYSLDKNRHYYFMALRSDAIIDATIKGNISRFINHSCDPNAETQKWTVNGELRIGFFSRKSIMPGEEITFNYQYQRYGREAQRCYCESASCRGWIGQEPTSDEGEQLDDEDDESEYEEETDASNLLVNEDDDDSDASVADPEEVQKQLEMAAAQAEVELAPLHLLEDKVKQQVEVSADDKLIQDLNKSDNEEDSKSKFKKLLSKMAEKVAAKQKQNKREEKLQRKKKSKATSLELTNKLRFLEDPDIEDEVEFLKECGLKNQSGTLRLSRLMVRAKLVQTRLNLLDILRKGDFPCRRLFLDYHGLRLLHGWMSEDGGNMQIRLSLLQTLETLPIPNKTVLTDSKVLQVVRNWCGACTSVSPNEDSSSSNSNSQETTVQSSTTFEEGSEISELPKLAMKLVSTWDGLPEIFRIPKKERIEQMKEHEREADRQYEANAETQEDTVAADRYGRNRFSRGLSTTNNTTNSSNRFAKPNKGNLHKTANTTTENVKNLSKAQRREMFAAKVARDEAEKRLAEERREFETKCRFFGLDAKKTRAQDIPFCVNPATGQWFSIERKPISTPPSYANAQIPVKPKSTDPNDYQLPASCCNLPTKWKYAITPQGKIYYYHIKHRISQWETPTPAQLQQCELEAREDDSESEISTTAGEDSSDDDDDVLIGMDAAQLKAYIDRKVEMRRQKRYQRLVDQRSISPRREEDRIYNQIEVRKYKENKEKIRKRKEDIRRKRAESLRQTSLNMCTLGSISDTNPNKLNTENYDEEVGALPIQDYLLSSDEEVDLKAEVNSPLIDKIVEGDKIVDELDALTTKRQLKRPLPPHRDFNEPPTSTSAVLSALIAKQEYKKRKLEKKEKRKPKEQDAKYRKTKEKFRCEIAGIIVHHLKPYLKETCTLGRIQSNEDFNHLARKLTHFVMIKELKYCESVGQTLVVTESVKSKSREFIKKYMAKYGEVYIKPKNDPDFKDIPFTL